MGNNANIQIPDANSVDKLTSKERVYLYEACSYTASAAETLVRATPIPTPRGAPLWPSIPVSESPTAAPTPSQRPTRSPNATPTARLKETTTSSDAPASSPSMSSTTTTIYPSVAPTPEDTSLVQKAQVTYYFHLDNFTAQQDGSGNNDDTIVSYLSDLQVALNRLAPKVTDHNNVRWDNYNDHESQRRQLRWLQEFSIILPTSFGKVAPVGTYEGVEVEALSDFEVCLMECHFVHFALW